MNTNINKCTDKNTNKATKTSWKSKQTTKINTVDKKNANIKKQKKGKKMYDLNQGLYSGLNNKTHGIEAGVLLAGDDVVNIKLTESKKNRGYIFYMQKDLQEIFKKSGSNAIDNEFQVHYWFLNFRYQAEDKSIIDIAIPTCYFNYEQFVTAGHVDFELKDVGPLSEKVMPLHNIKVNELLSFEIDKKISAIFGNKLTFEAMSVNFGTLHRHPGQSAHQNFSSTDLNINVTTEAHALGVVFPLADAEDDKPSFSAIIAIDGSTYYNKNTNNMIANLAHCEYRTANGKIQTGLNYEKNRCIAFNVIPFEQPSIVEKLFGSKPTRKSIVKYSNTENTLFNLEEKLLDIFEELESKWEASTLAVLQDNVKVKVHITSSFANKNINNSLYNNLGLYGTEDETQSYSEYFKGKILNTDSKEEADLKKDTETKVMQRSPYDKYLFAKSELTKINQNLTFIDIVKKYISIENEKKYLQTIDNTVQSLNDLISDYNIMSRLFLGKGHREEELSFYVANNIVDFRDISDFLNENINTAMAIVEESHLNIQLLKDYEATDSNALRSNHLYKNPFVEDSTNNSSEALEKNEVYDDMADAEAAQKQTNEYVKENNTVHFPTEPESGVVDTILGAVTKFMKG